MSSQRYYSRMALAVSALAIASIPAFAIDCKDGFQLVQGNYISTPYCQDALVAAVAAQYGIRVSAATIRENPNEKRTVCRYIGQDIRVRQSCLEVGGSRRR